MNETANRHAKAEPIAAVLAGRCRRDSGYRATIPLDNADEFWTEAAVAAHVSDGAWDYVPSAETCAYALSILDAALSDPFVGLGGLPL